MVSEIFKSEDMKHIHQVTHYIDEQPSKNAIKLNKNTSLHIHYDPHIDIKVAIHSMCNTQSLYNLEYKDYISKYVQIEDSTNNIQIDWDELKTPKIITRLWITLFIENANITFNQLDDLSISINQQPIHSDYQKHYRSLTIGHMTHYQTGWYFTPTFNGTNFNPYNLSSFLTNYPKFGTF